MRKDIKFKNYYFFVMLNVAGERITDATRFKYFLVDVWTHTKADSYEIETKADTKIKQITTLLSQQHNVTYEVAHVGKITTTAYNLFKGYFPHYNEEARAYDTADSSDEQDKEQEE